jgi:mannitol/fructose-specific phosphotransferase system IIA component (Ntr-type)
MLNNILNTNRIKIDAEASDWEEAIDLGGDILIRENIIEPRYLKAIKETKEKLGPYIVIAPGIAISHSKPEDGVLDVGMSLIRLKEPVDFGHRTNGPVKLLFTLATTDRKTHLEALRQLMHIFLREEDMNTLLNSRNVEEIAKVIYKHSENCN